VRTGTRSINKRGKASRGKIDELKCGSERVSMRKWVKSGGVILARYELQ